MDRTDRQQDGYYESSHGSHNDARVYGGAAKLQRLNTTVTQRATLLRASAALFGFAAAASFHDLLLRPAPAGQLPGFMTSLGYDAGSSFRFIGLIVLLPIVFALAMRPVADLLARDDVQRWARNAAILAPFGALWAVTLARSPLWVILPAALVITAA